MICDDGLLAGGLVGWWAHCNGGTCSQPHRGAVGQTRADIAAANLTLWNTSNTPLVHYTLS